MAKKTASIFSTLQKTAENAAAVNSELVRSLPVEALEDNPMNRFSMAEDEQFQATLSSVEKDGFLEDIVVTPAGEGRWRIVSGHRRVAAARKLGAAQIVVISRNGEDNYGNLSRHEDTQVIVNTTPVGMYPKCGVTPVSLEAFPQLEGVLDVVYNPLRTALVMEAEARSIPCSCGLPMLVAQARRAAELFTGADIPDDRLEEVVSSLNAQMRNVVLIGMPGCGKSAVGRALARRLGKEFLDLDRLIEAEAGKPIPEIFAEEGEDAFRALESAAARKAGARTGCILSTGGGVVTRPENYAPLHQNGVIVHLTRSLEKLPTAGRPVSQSTDLRALWRRREPLYQSFADLTADNNGSIEDTVRTVLKEVNGR